jgi:hypothetical protein
MEDQKMIDWIKEARAKGYDNAHIKNYLQQQGLQEDKINSLLAQVPAHKLSKIFLIGVISLAIIVVLAVVAIVVVMNLNGGANNNNPNNLNNPIGTTMPNAGNNNSVLPMNPNVSANPLTLPKSNPYNRMTDMLEQCINNSFEAFVKSPMGTSASANLSSDYVAPKGILYLPKYKFQMPESAVKTALTNYMGNQISSCMRSKSGMDIERVAVNISIGNNNLLINVTVTDVKNAKNSAYRIESIQ